MDTIFYNGNLYTVDPAIPHAEAVAVKNGVIVRVGSNEDVLALKTDETNLVDLNGKLMLPGFCDSHIHLLSYGYSLEKANLGKARSIDDIVSIGKAFLAEHPHLRWMQGRGWNSDHWDKSNFPTRYDLDRITTEIPMSYTRACGHIIIVNSKALEVMGVTRDTPQIEGGCFDLDENGEPLGIFREAARNLVYDAIPSLTVDDIKRMLINGGKKAQECGLTSLQSDDFEAVAEREYQNVLNAYLELSEGGALPVRVYEQCLLPPVSRLREFLALGYKTGDGNELFKIGPLKLLGDGSLGGRTAFLSRPYADDPTTQGIAVFTQDELDELVRTAHDGGMTVAVHAIGDGFMRRTFTAIERAMLANPRPDMRHAIIHCQITDEELLHKFRDLNVIAHIQPIFFNYDLHIAESRVGSDLIPTCYNWKTMLDLGVHVACGSDSPVESFNVMENIYSAVTRKDLSGYPEGGWMPEQKLTVEQAVYGFTQGGAYASYEEGVKGSITVGKYADFAVVDRDLFAIEPDEIKQASVCMTVLGGKIVYEKEPA